jgi:hypothetical protein
MKTFPLQFVMLLYALVVVMKTADAFSIQSRTRSAQALICSISKLEQQQYNEICNKVQSSNRRHTTPYLVANIVVSMIYLVPSMAYATTEVELTDLPPPWIPVVFGFGLIVVCYL